MGVFQELPRPHDSVHAHRESRNPTPMASGQTSADARTPSRSHARRPNASTTREQLHTTQAHAGRERQALLDARRAPLTSRLFLALATCGMSLSACDRNQVVASEAGVTANRFYPPVRRTFGFLRPTRRNAVSNVALTRESSPATRAGSDGGSSATCTRPMCACRLITRRTRFLRCGSEARATSTRSTSSNPAIVRVPRRTPRKLNRFVMRCRRAVGEPGPPFPSSRCCSRGARASVGRSRR